MKRRGKMKIINADKNDLKEVANLFKIEYSKSPYNERWTNSTINKKIKKYFNEDSIFVIKEKNQLVAFIIIHEYIWDKGNQGFIDEIVVSSKHQGKGYGKMLMNFAENYFKEKGIKVISLMSNTKSKAFKIYQKLNYKEHNFVSMEKRL